MPNEPDSSIPLMERIMSRTYSPELFSNAAKRIDFRRSSVESVELLAEEIVSRINRCISTGERLSEALEKLKSFDEDATRVAMRMPSRYEVMQNPSLEAPTLSSVLEKNRSLVVQACLGAR